MVDCEDRRPHRSAPHLSPTKMENLAWPEIQVSFLSFVSLSLSLFLIASVHCQDWPKPQLGVWLHCCTRSPRQRVAVSTRKTNRSRIPASPTMLKPRQGPPPDVPPTLSGWRRRPWCLPGLVQHLKKVLDVWLTRQRRDTHPCPSGSYCLPSDGRGFPWPQDWPQEWFGKPGPVGRRVSRKSCNISRCSTIIPSRSRLDRRASLSSRGLEAARKTKLSNVILPAVPLHPCPHPKQFWGIGGPLALGQSMTSGTFCVDRVMFRGVSLLWGSGFRVRMGPLVPSCLLDPKTRSGNALVSPAHPPPPQIYPELLPCVTSLAWNEWPYANEMQNITWTPSVASFVALPQSSLVPKAEIFFWVGGGKGGIPETCM